MYGFFRAIVDRARASRAPAPPRPSPDDVIVPAPAPAPKGNWLDEHVGTLPRGIRNKNPGNLRRSDPWVGLAADQSDPEFCRFDDHVFGLRALMIVLLTYSRRHKIDSVREVIARWAPPNENNTAAYVAQVAARLSTGPDDEINIEKRSTLIALTRAIVRHENGRPPDGAPSDWYSQDLYDRAADLAFDRSA
jgi:hypothetical protein